MDADQDNNPEKGPYYPDTPKKSPIVEQDGKILDPPRFNLDQLRDPNFYQSLLAPPSPITHTKLEDQTEDLDKITVPAASPQKASQDDHVQCKGLLGEKRQVYLTDLDRYGPDLVEIFKLSEAKKRAKHNLIQAQTNYEEVCSDLAKMKERLLEIFDDIEEND